MQIFEKDKWTMTIRRLRSSLSNYGLRRYNADGYKMNLLLQS